MKEKKMYESLILNIPSYLLPNTIGTAKKNNHSGFMKKFVYHFHFRKFLHVKM